MLVPRMIKLTDKNNKGVELYVNINELSEIRGNKASGYSIHLKNGNSHKVEETPTFLIGLLTNKVIAV